MDKNEIVKDALAIKRILLKGYHIAVWENGYGQENLYLVKDGESPWKGVYISKFEAH